MADTDGDLGDGANQNPGDSDGSNVDTTLEKLLEGFGTIKKQLAEVESQQRALQSGKDRDTNKVRKENKDLKEDIAEFREYIDKYGEDAEQRFETDLTLQRLLKLADTFETAQQVEDKVKSDAAADEVNPKLLKEYKVDPQSPEYLAHVKAGKTGLDLVLAVVAGIKPQEQKEGDATGASGGAGGAGAPSPAQAVLKDQYEKALDKAQEEFGFLSPSQLQDIEDEFAKKGLE